MEPTRPVVREILSPRRAAHLQRWAGELVTQFVVAGLT
jgi:hypothetical protein